MMDGWKVNALGDVCVIDKKKYDGEHLPYVGLEHIESKTGKFLGRYEPLKVKSTTFKFTEEHVLYGRLRPYLNKVLLPTFKGHCSSEIFPIKVKPDLDRKFFYYWISWYPVVKEIDKTCTGTRMPRANVNKVLEFEIPLPPLPEQKRIVAILDEAFAGIEKAMANTERNLANAKELFDSYLESVISEKGAGWEEKKIKSVCNLLNGFAFKSKDAVESSDVQLIRMGNLYKNNLDLNRRSSFYPDIFAQRYKRYVLSRGDLIISLTGTMDKQDYGYTVEIPYTNRKLLLNQRIAKFDNINEDIVNRRYFLHFLRSKPFLNKLYSSARGVRQANLSSISIKELRIAYPSISEQRRLADNFDMLQSETQRLQSIYQQKLTALAELKQSLLQKAFFGELTADEQHSPAEVAA